MVGRKEAQKAGNVVKIWRARPLFLTTSPAVYAFFLPTTIPSAIYKA